MDDCYDEKGKYYTNHTIKRSVPVLASAQGMMIAGTMHLSAGNRVKDEEYTPISGARGRFWPRPIAQNQTQD